MAWAMKVFKVSFMPVMGTDDKGNPTRVGRFMCFVTAPSAAKIPEILAVFMPELHDHGFDVVEEIEVASKNWAWSVSLGPPTRSYSIIVTAPDETAAIVALAEACKSVPVLDDYQKLGLFTARLIDLTKEGCF